MTINHILHRKLIDLQSDEELERKADKATRKDFFTQEDIDAAWRRGKKLAAFFAEDKSK